MHTYHFVHKCNCTTESDQQQQNMYKYFVYASYKFLPEKCSQQKHLMFLRQTAHETDEAGEQKGREKQRKRKRKRKQQQQLEQNVYYAICRCQKYMKLFHFNSIFLWNNFFDISQQRSPRLSLNFIVQLRAVYSAKCDSHIRKSERCVLFSSHLGCCSSGFNHNVSELNVLI